MTKLKQQIDTGLETLTDGVSDAAKKIGAAVDDGRHVLADAGKDAKDVATIATAKLKIQTRAAVRNARHGVRDFGAAAKKAGGEVRGAAERAAANIGGALRGPSEVAKKEPGTSDAD